MLSLYISIQSSYMQKMKVISFQPLCQQQNQQMPGSKKTFSGVKIVQQPGGNSTYQIGWGQQEEPVVKYHEPQIEPFKSEESKNPEKCEHGGMNVVQQAGDNRKSKGIKIVNPPGGKSNFIFG